MERCCDICARRRKCVTGILGRTMLVYACYQCIADLRVVEFLCYVTNKAQCGRVGV